jgi:hypothetical protein
MYPFAAARWRGKRSAMGHVSRARVDQSGPCRLNAERVWGRDETRTRSRGEGEGHVLGAVGVRHGRSPHLLAQPLTKPLRTGRSPSLGRSLGGRRGGGGGGGVAGWPGGDVWGGERDLLERLEAHHVEKVVGRLQLPRLATSRRRHLAKHFRCLQVVPHLPSARISCQGQSTRFQRAPLPGRCIGARPCARAPRTQPPSPSRARDSAP